MFTKIGGVFALAGMVGLSLFLLNCGSSSSRPAGTVYVLTQGSNGYGDNVTSFSLDLNSGDLSLVNSNASTCPAAASPSNPEPCGIPLDILLDPAGANAFVLNQGTPCMTSGILCQPSSSTLLPSIYSYSVNSDGSLSAPSSTGVNWTSGGDTAVAMVRDAAGQFLFVIDQGIYTDQANCSASGGPCCPMFGSSDAIYAGCPSISVFGIKGSTLTLESGSPFYLSKLPTSASPVTFVPGATVCGSSTSAELLFVTGNHDLLAQHVDNTVSVFCVSSTGGLSPQANSPYAVAAVDPVSVQAVNTNAAGQITNGGVFVYVGNNGPTGNVSPFFVCTVVNGTSCATAEVMNSFMFPITNCPTSCILAAGGNPTQTIVDPTNNFLYVMSQGSSQVYGFRINTTAGPLTPLDPPNLPTGSQPISMALHPTFENTGQFLFTSNSGSSNLTGFTLNAATGSMVNPITVVAPAAPSGIAVH